MHASRALPLLLVSLLLLDACSRRKPGGDDDDDNGGDGDGDGDSDGDADGDSDICPGFGAPCPGGFLCEGGQCVSDPCGGDHCCDARPCADTALDCVDGECVVRATVGNPCASDGDCTGDHGQCLFATEGWPDGYCIQNCVGDEHDCPGDGVCVGSSCFDGCFVPGDCRLGYECIEVPGGKTCSPQ